MTVRGRIVDWIPAIAVFCLGIVVWQASIEIFNIQKFLLPKPGSIASAFWTQLSLTCSFTSQGSKVSRLPDCFSAAVR